MIGRKERSFLSLSYVLLTFYYVTKSIYVVYSHFKEDNHALFHISFRIERWYQWHSDYYLRLSVNKLLKI